MGGDLEEQGDELLALSTILETQAFSYSAEPPHMGSLEVEVRLDSPLSVVTPDRGDFQVSHLPPLKMEFSLPPDYPSLCPPLFLLSCPWLLPAQKAGVEARLDQLWQENRGGVILFLWLNFLQEEVMDFLQLSSSLDLRQFEAVVSEEPHTEPEPGLEKLRIVEDGSLDREGQDSPPSQDSADSGLETGSEPGLALQGEVVESGPGARTSPSESESTSRGCGGSSESKSKVARCSEGVRVRGRVRKYRLRGREGVVDTDRGAALVRGWDITEGGRECVEASLEVGEEVEVVLVEREGRFEGGRLSLAAVSVCGVGGGAVRGDRRVERGRVLAQGQEGRVVSWSRDGDGLVLGPGGEVYCWHGGVQEEGGRLAKGDIVTFSVVESRRWGVVATWVRRKGQELDRSGKDEEIERVAREKVVDDLEHEEEESGAGAVTANSLSDPNLRESEPVTPEVEVEAGQAARVRGFLEELQPPLGAVARGVEGGHVVGVVGPGLARQSAPAPRRRRRSVRAVTRLATLLREFNNMKLEQEFSVQLFSCQICYTDRTGGQCLRFMDCQHVYCR